MYPRSSVEQVMKQRNFRQGPYVSGCITHPTACFLAPDPSLCSEMQLRIFRMYTGASAVCTRFWVVKPEGKRQPGRCKSRWKENIKMDVR
jgi:hypothetical protein